MARRYPAHYVGKLLVLLRHSSRRVGTHRAFLDGIPFHSAIRRKSQENQPKEAYSKYSTLPKLHAPARATLEVVERRSITEFLQDFLSAGSEPMFVQRRGYRTVRWTYRQVAESSFQFARELESRGVGKGDRVVLWSENCAEWVGAFFGCALRGAIAVPMDDAATPDFASRVYQQVSAKMLVCSAPHLNEIPGSPSIVLDDIGELAWECPVEHSAARRGDREIPKVRALGPSCTFSQSASPESCLWTIPGNLSSTAYDWNCGLSGVAQSY